MLQGEKKEYIYQGKGNWKERSRSGQKGKWNPGGLCFICVVVLVEEKENISILNRKIQERGRAKRERYLIRQGA